MKTMKHALSISQKGLVVVLFLLMTEVLFVGILSTQMIVLQRNLEIQKNERAIVSHLTRMLSWIVRLNFSILREQFLTNAGEKHGSRPDYTTYVAGLERELTAVEQLTHDEPVVHNGLQRIRQLDHRIREDLADHFKRGHWMTREDALGVQAKRKEMIGIAEKIISRYGVDVDSAQKTAANLDYIKRLLLFGLILNALTILAVGALFWKQVARRIQVVSENIERFNHGEELLEPVGGNDEIATVDQIFRKLSSELMYAAEQERLLVQNSIDVICSIDSRGVFTEVSSASIEQWGWAPDELIGREVSEVLHTKNIPQIFQNRVYENAEESSRFEDTDEITRRDGTVVHTLWASQWSASDGSFFCFVRDASEINHIQNMLVVQKDQIKESIENIPLGILTIGSNGQIQTANKSAYNLLAPAAASDSNVLTASKIDSIMSPTTGDNPSLSELLLTSSVSSAIRCSATTTDGKQLFVDVTPGQSSDRKTETLVVLFDDATERVRLEEMKHNYVTLLGQSMRDPLAIVRSIISAQVANNAKVTERQQQRIQRTVLNIDRLLKLIDELLDIEKLATGKLVDELLPCNVFDVVLAAFNAVSDHAEQQKIKLVCDAAAPASAGPDSSSAGAAGGTGSTTTAPAAIARPRPAESDRPKAERESSVILADQQRLVQVIVNLLTNAIKYSPANTTVSLSVARENDAIKVEVIDQGRGLPVEMHEKIFESYVQTQKSDAKRGTGTGLGLAICKQIVEKHGGIIGVTSEVGKGSNFWIRLPVVNALTDRATQ